MLHSRHIDGHLAYFVGKNRRRLVEVLGPDVVKYVTDFVRLPVDNTTGDPTEWTTTVVEVGAGSTLLAQLDGSGGFARITTAAGENDGGNYQLNGESFQLKTTSKMYFGVFGLKLDDVVQSDLFLGLAITDTTILGGVTDRIGFESLDGSAALDFVLEKDSTETKQAAVHTLVNDTPVDIEFFWDGATIEVFVNGVSVARPAVTNLPDDEAQRLSWAFLAGEAVAKTCDIDTIRIFQIGR